MKEKKVIIANLTEEDRLANHIPEEIWELSKTNNVFLKDEKTGELIQILDLKEGGGDSIQIRLDLGEAGVLLAKKNL